MPIWYYKALKDKKYVGYNTAIAKCQHTNYRIKIVGNLQSLINNTSKKCNPEHSPRKNYKCSKYRYTKNRGCTHTNVERPQEK